MPSGKQLSEGENAAEKRRRNSFDVLRLIAALAVAFGHQTELAGLPEPSIGPLHISISNTGLFAFFALSGYLIFKSLERDPRTVRFAAARLLRIYPGAIVNTVLCVLMGSTVTSMTAALYWQDPATWSYLVHGMAIVFPPTRLVLPGVFTEAPWPDVNTPIWTLKYELVCYLALFGLCRVARLQHRIHLMLLVLVSILMTLLCAYFALLPLPPADKFYTHYNIFNFLRLSTVFATGAYLASVEEFEITWKLLPIVLCVAMIMLSAHDAVARVGQIILSAVLIVEIGRSSLLFSHIYRSVGDLSFGIYLYAYPISQLFMMLIAKRLSFWSETSLSFIFTIMIATASWYLIEIPAQKIKRMF